MSSRKKGGGKDDGDPRRSKKRSRPSPPPPPPESLVRLLQSDKQVLEYFQSLQDNLDADVQIWKDRAQKYKQENEQLQKQLDKKNGRRPRGKAKSKKKPPPKAPPDQPKEAPKGKAPLPEESAADGQGNKKYDAEEGQPINDSMFELESSGDEEEEASGKLFKMKEKEKVSNVDLMEEGQPINDSMFELESSSDEEDEASEGFLGQMSARKSRVDVLALLKEAFASFEELGIPLTEEYRVEQIEEESEEQEPKDETMEGEKFKSKRTIEDDSDESEAEQIETKPGTVVARTNEDVAADILQSIRNLTRIQLSENEQMKPFPPFITDELIPSCNHHATDDSSSQHPAAEAKLLLFRALVICDTFCSPSVSDDKWNSYFVSDESLHLLKLGLRDRKTMVDGLIESLEEDMSQAWACADRSSRLTMTALHYDRNREEASSKPASDTLVGEPKSLPRLSSLLERRWLAEMAIGFYLSREQPQKAIRLVLDYTMSTCPALLLEDYPRLPPVLSLVVLEGLLQPDPVMFWWREDENTQESWLFSCWRESAVGADSGLDNLFRSVALCIHATAFVWKERLQSSDERIYEVSRVEMASYERLLESEASWLGTIDSLLDQKQWKTGFFCQQAQLFVLSIRDQGKDVETHLKVLGESNLTETSLQLALVLGGKLQSENFNSPLALLDGDGGEYTSIAFLTLLKAWSGAYQQLEIRQLDTYRQRIGSAWKESRLPRAVDQPFGRMLDRLPNFETEYQYQLLVSIMDCCARLADGCTASRTCHLILQYTNLQDIPESIQRDVFNAIKRVAELPVVRVINLERRKDRRNAFTSQALRHGLLIVKAIVDLTGKASSESNFDQDENQNVFFGGYAFDGQGRMAEAHERLTKQVGSVSHLDALVAIHWRPHNLKPFDRYAPDDDNLVRTSPSERACALSHVASWKGVLASLRLSPLAPGFENNQNGIFHHPERLWRLFRISGFAEGKPLHYKNANLPPAPVCVVLEDDAILVDRFVERLKDLLRELPRDFHFCSLGYSRPKTAPVVTYSSQIGIPTCIYYLTGYVLSQAGAEHLLANLPVVGPVDSWIGLKMVANWENVFGASIGVGTHSKPTASPPSRKDLCRILQFRAFCAMQPLCSQRVGTSVGGAVPPGRSWRNRDTDIEYSGDSLGRKRKR